MREVAATLERTRRPTSGIVSTGYAASSRDTKRSRRPQAPATVAQTLRDAVALTIGLPLALLGIVIHGPGYRATDLAVRRCGPSPTRQRPISSRRRSCSFRSRGSSRLSSSRVSAAHGRWAVPRRAHSHRLLRVELARASAAIPARVRGDDQRAATGSSGGAAPMAPAGADGARQPHTNVSGSTCASPRAKRARSSGRRVHRASRGRARHLGHELAGDRPVHEAVAAEARRSRRGRRRRAPALTMPVWSGVIS